MEVLEVKELTKIYGSGENQVTALDHVSFQVKKGEFIAIVGASGSGKSTLMNLIGGIDRPTSGSVVIDGKKIFDMNESEMAIFRRRNIGIVYQFYNLIPNLTVDENIMLPCLLDQRKPDAGKLDWIVEMTGLSHRRKHLPGQLSGGQQQRVSVGRALINDPAFILADEPTGNLDSRSGREVIELLMAANRKAGQTLILITHDENIALQADRILTISDGRIIRDEVIRG
nr:ABC transporter ATP-binding protein [uncultured Blautia sp.]